MRVVGRLDQEQILHHHAFHRGKAGRHVLGVGIRLEDVLALDVEALERAVDGGVHHVGNAQARFGSSGRPHSASNMARVASSDTWR